MTNASQKLCRDIAEAEYPESVIRIVGEEVYIVEKGYSPRPFSRYITDPAETVRMLEALLARVYAKPWKHYKQGFGISFGDKEEEEEKSYLGIDLAHAVAEAYLAMLQAKQGREEKR